MGEKVNLLSCPTLHRVNQVMTKGAHGLLYAPDDLSDLLLNLGTRGGLQGDRERERERFSLLCVYVVFVVEYL